jgi:hypothetical protein
LGIFPFQDNRPALLKEGTYASADYGGLVPLIAEF